MSWLTMVAGWLLRKVAEKFVERATDHALQKAGVFEATCQTCSTIKASVVIAEAQPRTLVCDNCGHAGTILIESVTTLSIHEVKQATIYVDRAEILISKSPEHLADCDSHALPWYTSEEDDVDFIYELQRHVDELQKQGRHREAVEEWKKAIAYDPHDSGVYHNLGCLCEDAEMYDEAEVWYRRAVDLGDYGSAANLGHLLESRGQIVEALRFFKMTIAYYGDTDWLIEHVKEIERWLRR